MALISKIQLGGVTYDLKDATARANIATLLGDHALEALGAAAWQGVANEISGTGLIDAATVKSYVDAQVGAIHNFDVKIYDKLPAASADTMFILGLVADAQASAGEYIEYITLKKPDDSYVWEKIGSTKTDLTGYVSKETTIVGVALDHNITKEELVAALGLKALAFKDSAAGTVEGQVISGVKASGTTTGTLKGALAFDSTKVASTGNFTPEGAVTGTVTATGTVASEASVESTSATLTRGDYTPAGDVAVTPAAGTVAAIKTVGTKASFTEGKFTAATLTKEDKNFAVEGIVASYKNDATDSETLVLTAAGTAQASNVTAFDGGSKAADTFTANELPTSEDVNVVTGITSATFTGTKETGLKVTGATYDKVTGVTSTFIGNAKGDAITATFKGTVGDVAVTGNYDKANLGTVAFEGAAIEVAVGDITVAEKDVTVQ